MATGLGTEIQWYSPTVSGGLDNADDQSGNGNHGTYENTSTPVVTVVADTGSGGTYAYKMNNGARSYVSVPSHVDGNLKSVSYWANLDTVSTTRTLLFDCEDSITGDGNGGLFCRSTSNRLQLFCGNGSWNTSSFNSSATLSNNTWFHIVIQQDGTNTEIWIDGSLDSTTTNTDNPWATSSSNGIAGFGSDGRSGAGNTSTVNKWMDDIRWHDRALTSAEITHLASARGVLGPPGGPSTFYNPFANKRFTQNYNSRIR